MKTTVVKLADLKISISSSVYNKSTIVAAQDKPYIFNAIETAYFLCIFFIKKLFKFI